MIPKIVNGRNKVFFFFSYEGQRQTSLEALSETTVYTPLEAQGNFSGSPGAGASGRISGRQSHTTNPIRIWPAQGIIDPNSISPVAKAYFANNLIPIYVLRIPVSASAGHRQLQRISRQAGLQHHLPRPVHLYLHAPALSAILSVHGKQRARLSGHQRKRHILRHAGLHAYLHARPVERTAGNRATAGPHTGCPREQATRCQPAWHQYYARPEYRAAYSILRRNRDDGGLQLSGSYAGKSTTLMPCMTTCRGPGAGIT